MNPMDRLVSAAEKAFDRHGFVATGIDRLTELAGISSRTLYKHAGNKAQLMAAVLNARGHRFMRRIDVQSVDSLFSALEEWIRVEGARGCLFLRARAETGGETPDINEAVKAHKVNFDRRVKEIVAADLGRNDPVLAAQVLILFEGATHASIYKGAEAVSVARTAAALLVQGARV
jgi:AcrR family transcriptional regulator